MYIVERDAPRAKPCWVCGAEPVLKRQTKGRKYYSCPACNTNAQTAKSVAAAARRWNDEILCP